MNTCMIFCAGGFDRLLEPPEASDYILAADGGYAHVRQLGLTPDGVLGDFDSLGYVPEEAQVFPVEKDDTDSMLAIRKGLELGYRKFLLYGSLDGPRLDHTVANIQALRFLAEHGAQGYLVGLNQIAAVVKNGELSFPAGCRGYISVFCLGDKARDVTLQGLYYPLEEAELTGTFPLGASNQFTGQPARIGVRNGCLLVIWDRDNGLPKGGAAC